METAPSGVGSRSYVTAASTAPAYWMIGILWRVLATGIQTGGTFCLLDQQCPAGSGPTRHDHPQDEGLYIVSGSVSFQAGGSTFTAGPGSLVTVPRHTDHSFVVEEEANLVNFYLPAGFEMFLMGGAVPAAQATLPPKDTPMPPMALLMRLSEDYGGMPLTQERSTSPNPDAIAPPGVATAATARTYRQDGARWAVLADGASTGGSYSAFEVEIPGGCGIAAHRRDHVDEVYYLLDGEADITIDDRSETMSAGSIGFVLHGTVTKLSATSAVARVLVIHTAPGYERLLATVDMEERLSKDGNAPVDDKRLRDLHADIGLRIIP